MSGRDVGIVALLLIGVLILVPLLGSGMMGGWGGGMPLIGGLFWLAILAGIVLLVTSAIRHQWPSRSAGAEEQPLDILKRRLAKGEITREEYESLKKELS
jgi:putative membrane protein